jgi:hypothetical protein
MAERTDVGLQRTGDGEKRQMLLHLEANVIKALKKAAVDRETSASAIASEAISDWLKKNSFPQR